MCTRSWWLRPVRGRSSEPCHDCLLIRRNEIDAAEQPNCDQAEQNITAGQMLSPAARRRNGRNGRNRGRLRLGGYRRLYNNTHQIIR